MKKNILIAIALVFSVPAYAQSEDDSATSTGNVVEQSRPDMPVLFYRPEERRVLEAIRQGVVDQGDVVLDVFVPVVITDTAVSDIISGEVVLRQKPLEIDAYIKNKSTGAQTFWINDREISSEELIGTFNEREGLEFRESGARGSILGGDSLSGSEFEIKVGQVILMDGRIEELLPVVKKNKN